MIEQHIASFVVQIQPILFNTVVGTLERLPTCECAQSDAQTSKSIILIEATSSRNLDAVIDSINAINGVITTTMVYHHCENANALVQETT